MTSPSCSSWLSRWPVSLFLERRGRLSPGWAGLGVATLLVADLAHAGAGINPQVDVRFYEPLPELAALRLSELDGDRVFSYGLDHSPAFRELLSRGGPGLTLTSFFIHRQLLGPYSNVLDAIEAGEATDITSFLPRERELAALNYDPGRAGELVPWLRNAGVGRVLSLDPLQDSALEPLASVDAGAAGVAIHVYRLAAWPRSLVVCAATLVASREQALAFPYREGFDPRREVALEGPAGVAPADTPVTTCREGQRAAHGSLRGRGALPRGGGRPRLPRRAREPCAWLARQRGRRARAGAARERQAPRDRGARRQPRSGAPV